ncbi:hypothetical protein Dimus_011865 [Dionaea muscipula]
MTTAARGILQAAGRIALLAQYHDELAAWIMMELEVHGCSHIHQSRSCQCSLSCDCLLVEGWLLAVVVTPRMKVASNVIEPLPWKPELLAQKLYCSPAMAAPLLVGLPL